MAINPLIPLQAKYTPTKVPNMLEQRARGQEVQLNQMKLQQGQQDQQEKNALRQIISQPGFDPYNQETQQAMRQAAPSHAHGVIAKYGEFQKANDDAQKAKRNRAIGEIVNFDTPQQARDSLSGYVTKGELSQEQADNMASQIPNDPALFKIWQVQKLRGMLSSKDQLGDRRKQGDQRLQWAKHAQTVRSDNADRAATEANRARPIAMQKDMYERAAYESNISVGELVKREDYYPKVSGGLEQAEDEIDSTVEAIDTLIKNPNLGEIAGFSQGRWDWFATSDGGRAALSQYNMIAAKGTLRALQSLKAMSPRGSSGLGATSDNEMNTLTQSQASIDRKQGKKYLIEGLTDYRDNLKASKERLKNVFNETYQYRNSEAYRNKGGAGGNPSGDIDYNDPGWIKIRTTK